MISKTSGALENPQGIRYGSTGIGSGRNVKSTFIPLIFLQQSQADNTRIDQKNGFKLSWQIMSSGTHGSGHDYTLSFDDNYFKTLNLTNTTAGSWSTVQSTDEPRNGKTTETNDSSVKIKKTSGGLFATCDTIISSIANCPTVDGLHLIELSDTSDVRDVEKTGTKSETTVSNEWSIFDQNESCSSYLMKTIIAKNTNIVNSNIKSIRTFPTMGEA